ncbi:MAG: DUF3501 family protein [Alphaproteobacteria bacterium]|nr:DUF3501 family protein [Alphaproteobacteria bacterium]MDE2109746.1 DUF3501 family protein [Alphaproteobacteria bacterium]MDE2494370.1 DUF3501 family protein [Alphaproteobacteria bacterium]
MSAIQRKITPADILPDAEYAMRRDALRKAVIAAKKNRRMEVGPFATFYFENYDTMWLQVMEMLRIEKGGMAQAEGEMEVYNPLIPQGRELIATLMLEIEDAVTRDRTLRKLGGIEETVFLELGSTRIKATPTEYDDRTTPDGKTSSVHWLRFVFTAEQIKAFESGERAVLGVAHRNYGHMAVLPDAVRAELAKDFA